MGPHTMLNHQNTLKPTPTQGPPKPKKWADLYGVIIAKVKRKAIMPYGMLGNT